MKTLLGIYEPFIECVCWCGLIFRVPYTGCIFSCFLNTASSVTDVHTGARYVWHHCES